MNSECANVPLPYQNSFYSEIEKIYHTGNHIYGVLMLSTIQAVHLYPNKQYYCMLMSSAIVC